MDWDCLEVTDEVVEDDEGSDVDFDVPRCPSLSAMRLIMKCANVQQNLCVKEY